MKNINFNEHLSKPVICRICGKKTKMGILKKHSDICKTNEELKKEDKTLDDSVHKCCSQTKKLKKHFMSKIQLNRFLNSLFIFHFN